MGNNQTIRLLAGQGSYRNSREIMLGGISYTMREVLMVAPLIAGLNVYLVGGTGKEKPNLQMILWDSSAAAIAILKAGLISSFPNY